MWASSLIEVLVTSCCWTTEIQNLGNIAHFYLLLINSSGTFALNVPLCLSAKFVTAVTNSVSILHKTFNKIS